ncbi:MAG TPA: AgmX/PglI C-terminal domain-containing protein [Myxococcota bacterium]
MSPSSAKKKARSARPDETARAANDRDGANDDDGDDATRGEWLFKQNDLVLGPVTSIVLVDKIKKGELDADTPIARDGAAFRPMKLVRLFREAWNAAEEEKRFAAEEKAHQSAVSRARFLRVVVVLLFFAVPAAAAGGVARQLMITRPWDDSASWIARVPPMVDLPQKPPTVTTPSTTSTPPPVVASNTPVEDDDDDDDKNPNAPRDPNKPKKPKKDPGATSTTSTPVAGGAASPASEPDKPAVEPARPSTAGLPGELTNAQAVAPLKEIQGDLKTCFKAEMDSNPDMPAQVTLSYTVTEDGKAINVDLDARELRGRPVVGCVQKAMGTVRWPRFNGERKNVSVPFKLGKPKPPAAPK